MKDSCSFQVYDGARCTAAAVAIGSKEHLGYQANPLPAIVARGYDNGVITLSVMPHDTEPFVLRLPRSGMEGVHDGAVTAINVLQDPHKHYILISGGEDGAILVWYVRAL